MVLQLFDSCHPPAIELFREVYSHLRGIQASFCQKIHFFHTFIKKHDHFCSFLSFAKVVCHLFSENTSILGVFETFWTIVKCHFFIFGPSDIPGKWKSVRFLRRGSFRKAQIPWLFGGGGRKFPYDRSQWSMLASATLWVQMRSRVSASFKG